MTVNILSPKYLLAAVHEYERNKAYMGQEFFPEKTVGSFEVMWDQFVYQNGIASVYGINAEIQPGKGDIVRRMFADVINMGAARTVKEEHLLIIRDGTLATVTETSTTAAQLAAHAREHVARLVKSSNDEVETLKEYMMLGALQGKLTWPPPGMPANDNYGNINFEYEWPLLNVFARTPISTLPGGSGKSWFDPTADIAEDIMAFREIYESELGTQPDTFTFIGSQKIINALFRNQTIRDLNKYTAGDFTNASSLGAVNSVLQNHLGINIRRYSAQYSFQTMDAVWAEPTVHWNRFIPENRLIVIPDFADKPVGNFLSAPSLANNFQSGKFTWVKDYTDPWVTKIGVGYRGFPYIAHPESIAVFEVDR